MSNWIDIEFERPKNMDRIICLIPFGMRVVDDTYIEGEGFLNHKEYVSHWMPINPPGSYPEIMKREQGPLGPTPKMKGNFHDDLTFSKAVVEHLNMMDSLVEVQFLLRLKEKAMIQVPLKKAD